MFTEEQFSPLHSFRQAAYECLDQGRDALFELCDAVMLTPSANSFVELSLCPAFRRRWPIVYEALEDGRIDRDGLVGLYVGHMPSAERPLLAGDHPPMAAGIGADVARSDLCASVDPDSRQ